MIPETEKILAGGGVGGGGEGLEGLAALQPTTVI